MYANLKKMYDNTHPVMWSMAIAHLLNIGFNTAVTITDEQIETLEENGMMTKEFVQGIVRLARDIAVECGNNVVELIQFCEITKPFDIKFYKAKGVN